MIEGFKTVGKSVAVALLLGALAGVILGALTGEYLLWVGIMAFIGANLGLALAYGMLPER